jgi:hypothetical protein
MNDLQFGSVFVRKSEEMVDLAKQNEILAKQNEILVKKNEDLVKENESLVNQNKDLVKDNEAVAKKNEDFEQELVSLKENVLYESMNDMKDAYAVVIRENESLKNSIKEHDDGALKKYKKKSAIQNIIITRLKAYVRQFLVNDQLLEETVDELADDEDQIIMVPGFCHGLFAQSRTARNQAECFIEYEITQYENCMNGVCEIQNCFRCRDDEHVCVHLRNAT